MSDLQTSVDLPPHHRTVAAGGAKAAGRARRRRALLLLAERHGEIRVAVSGFGRVAHHARDVLELLDELNAAARLRWGGVRKHGDATEMVYLRA